MSKINVDNATFRYYDSGEDIFKLLNVDFCEQKINVILGKNGVGKTTLLKCIIGEYKLNEGTINSDKNIVYIPDEPFFQSELKVKEYISFLSSVSGSEFVNRLNNYIKLFELENLGNYFIKELSKGQKHKFAYSIALATKSNIYIFDEPLLYLDIESQKILNNTLINLAKNENKTLIITTHILSNAYNLGDVIFYMKKNGVEKELNTYSSYEEFCKSVEKKLEL